MDGWNKFAAENEKHDFDDYCKPGDIVDEGVYDYFLDILLPNRWSKNYLQVGEPSSTRINPKTGNYDMTYITFTRYGKNDSDSLWEYKGKCFSGETENTDVYIEYKNIQEFLKNTFKE